jgi:group II intron reverse transcriptase/maturase
VEERVLTERNTVEASANRTQGRLFASFGLNGVRQRAEQYKDEKFTSLLHHITPLLLRKSYYLLKHKAAYGIDELTWDEYYADHLIRIEELHERVHNGSYRAQPVRRSYIQKEDGKQRPLGIAALEDKIVQQAVRIVLNQIYEADFVNFSYGFREGRSQHNALDALYVGITQRKINWILDADIQGCFDNIDHEWMQKMLEKRIGDKRILRLIRKWLKTGYVEDGRRVKQEIGTPQGAVISPMLANIFLHYAFDKWAAQWRKNKVKGDMIIVRYADDFVIGFQNQPEALKFLSEMKLRLEKFGMKLHPEKTRLIEFGRYASSSRKRSGKGKPETFDYLGFTHICSKTKKGDFFLRRKTIKKRFKRTCKEVKQELWKRMHDSIKKTGLWLASVITGYTNYYAVPGNMKMVKAFYTRCVREWLRVLRRRSQKARNLKWKEYRGYLNKWINRPRLVHPFPDQRFRALALKVRAG